MDELTKIEVGLIGKLLAAISIESFRDLITKNVLDAFITSHENTNVEFNFGRSKPDPEAVTFLREREIVLSDKTASKLEGDLKYQLLEGLKGNESIDMITRRLGTIFTDMMPWQLERVARTEVLNAQNAGRLSAYEKSGVVEYKMIIGATDKRLCGLCRRMRGQVQELDQPFVDPENMGDKWMHPPFHPSGRCSTVPLMNLPDSTITIGGQTYAADKKLGKVEIPIDLLKARQKRKAWVVRYANGYAVQCFEDEADADYFIETSKKKGDGWFDFISKVYREVKPGWVIHRKGTKTTMKFMSPEERKAFDEKLLREDKRVNKVEVDTGVLNKNEKRIWIKPTSERVGHWRKIKGSKPDVEQTEIDTGQTETDSLSRIKAIIPNVRFDGATEEQLNSIADAMEVTIGKFPGVNVDSIGWTTHIDDSSYGLPDAAYIPKNRGNPKSRIILRKTVADGIKPWAAKSKLKFSIRKENNIEYCNDMIKGQESWGEPEEAYTYREQLKDINACPRLFVALAGEDRLKGIIIHECYHAIGVEMELEDVFSDKLTANGVTRRDKMTISDYGASKDTELWAETGLAIELGIDIPDSVKRAFEDTMETIR